MKTRFITALIALLLCSAGIKTSAENNSTVIWGVKASVDAELQGKWHGDRATITMFSPGYGFTFGAVSNIYLGKNFYFEPGVSLFYSQYRYKDLYISVDQQEKDPKLYKCGVQVPIVFGYSFDFSGRFLMNLFTGPQIRYAFAGKIKINNSELLEELDSEFDLWGVNGQRRFDCSWKIGVGFPVNNFCISVEADLGMTDLLKRSMKFRENRVGVGVSYYF